MPKFLAERDLAGPLSAADQHALAQRCNEGVDLLAGRTQWLQTFVTDGALVCLYIADESASIADHAHASGLAYDRISEVRATLDPTTAEYPSGAG